MRFLRDRYIFALISLGTCWTGKAMASTALQIPGPTSGYFTFADAALADSWTQNFSVTDGSISMDIQGLGSGGDATDFYLTTNIGATATLSDLIRFTSIEVPFALTYVTPFTGLDLGPGTYYLIVADYTPNNNGVDGPDWNYYAGANIEEAPGLTLNPMLSAISLGPFAPAADFAPVTIPIQGTVYYTGTITTVASTPEPSTMLMIAVALCLIGIVRARRRTG
jgi:hypothetical protein